MAHCSFNSARWSYWRSASNVASPPPLAALPGSTKAPLHLFATHIVDRHHLMTHGTFFLQWWHVHQDSFRRRTSRAAPAARPCLIPSPKLRTGTPRFASTLSHRGIYLLPAVAFLLGAHFISVSFPSVARQLANAVVNFDQPLGQACSSVQPAPSAAQSRRPSARAFSRGDPNCACVRLLGVSARNRNNRYSVTEYRRAGDSGGPC